MTEQFLKKFLFIVNSFPPVNNQNSLRALEISKRLIEEKIYPIILTRRVERREPKDDSLLEEVPNNLKIVKTPMIELKRKYSLRTLFFKIIGKLFNIYTYIHWVPFGYFMGRNLLKKENSIKFIYSTGPPYYSHIISYLLKKKFKIPLIVEYRDPWNLSPWALKHKRDLDQLIGLKIERKILNSADMIIAVSEPLILFLMKNFPEIKNKPKFVIENGLNLKDNILSDIDRNERIIFTFIGKIYGRRDIFPLLKIISELKTHGIFDNFKFELKIFGKYNFNYLNKTINQLNIEENVYLGEFLPRARIFEEIAECYLAVHIGENLNYPTIGFKVWDYLSCRKKILYLGREDSYTAKFLKKNDFGVVIPINNIKKARDIFKNLILDIRNNRFINLIEKNEINKFSWDNKVKKLRKCLEEFF